MSSTPWYENFFSGFILDALRRMFPEEQTQAEAAFLKEALALGPGSRVLDAPCGYGRLSLALAAEGCHVTGIDIAPELIDEARQAATSRNLPASFERRDMRDLPWTDHFDAAFCCGNSFAYFEEDGNEAFLQEVHRSLKPGGRFVLETSFLVEIIYAMGQAGQMGRRWFPFGDQFFLHESSSDPFAGKQTSNYLLIKNGQMERKQALYQLYTLRELLRLLAQVGFVGVEVYGGVKKEPFQIGLSAAWFVMRRE